MSKTLDLVVNLGPTYQQNKLNHKKKNFITLLHQVKCKSDKTTLKAIY